MKRALLLTLLAATPAFAQDTTPITPVTPETPPARTPPVRIEIAPTQPGTTTAPTFLMERGVLSSDELVEKLNAKLVPEQRAILDRALAKRNEALAKANDELSATLRNLLRETNEGLTKRVDQDDEDKRMERMKRLQPGRYQHLMREKKKQEAKAAKEKAEPKPQPTP